MNKFFIITKHDLIRRRLQRNLGVVMEFGSLDAAEKYNHYYYLLFTGNAYPSKPKIDGVGSAK